MKAPELRKRAAKLLEDARAVHKQAADEARTLTAEEREKVDKIMTDSDDLLKQALQVEALEEQERQMAALRLGDPAVDPVNDTPTGDRRTRAEVERSAFRNFLRFGWSGIPAGPEREAANRRRVSLSALRDSHGIPEEVQAALQRAAQTVTTTGGGYLIPVGFQAELDVAMAAFGGMLEAGRIVLTSTGNTLDWPTVDDTAQTGELLGINTQVNEQAITYGQVQFGAYKYSSKAVLVPVELMQDSAFDIDSHVRELLARRLGTITNQHLTTGTGSGQPNGAVTASVDSSVTLDVSDLAAYSINNWHSLISLEHSIDPSYRVMPSVRWMMHDTLLRDLKQILDTNGRPIFKMAEESSQTPGGIGSINGYPVAINQDMPTPTGTNKALLFGDFSKYIIRAVRPMVLLRLEERYADLHQTGFFAFERLDGDLIDAGTNPLKHALMTA